MIPRIIHYCWFGRNEKPEIVEKCIESWKKECPDYKIVEWNEDNFDVLQCKYAAEAYEAKKWAFVSDYARIKILRDHGGIYIDTDVELIKPLDDLLWLPAFVGFEKGLNKKYGVNTGAMIGAEAGNEYLILQEKAYQGYSFIDSCGKPILTTCVEYTTSLLEKHGLINNNTRQLVLGIEVLPSDYFSPLDMDTGKLNITENTFSIHKYAGTWSDETTNAGYHMKWEYVKKYGSAGKILYIPKYVIYILKSDGIRVLLQKVKNKINGV